MENQQILNYKILKKIGLGGAITLYAAHEIDNPEKVVVAKIFDKSLASDKAMQQRFDKVLPEIAKLSNSNIIKILSYHRTEDYMAIFSEGLGGQNLQFVVLIKGLSKQAILEIFTYILKAVDYAHSQNIIHRNLKPSNIFISGKPKDLKVLDFCVADILGLENPDNLLKLNIENPLFMSPEMVNGGTVDIRSDVYSLGALLYFMFSHKTPYLKTAPNNVLVENVINDPVPELKGYFNVNKVIQKATAKNPDERYQNCSEFLEEIKKL